MGIFTLAYELIRLNKLPPSEAEMIQELIDWFKLNLPIPKKFSKGKNKEHKNTHGISWLIAEEKEMVEKFWELKNILDRAGYPVDFIKTDYPGKIVYKDKFQVVAV